MKKTSKRVNLNDIARMTGTSKSTVSRVLRKQSRVAPETRERIERAIREYNYEPSLFARGMTGARTGLIGVLSRWMESGFFADVIRGIDDEVKLHGGFLLCSFADDPDEYVRIWRSMSSGRQVDGMILVAPSMDIFHEAVEEDIKPTVLCATSGTGDANGWQEMPAVTINNRKAMNDLVSFLASSGFRKLTHIAGLPDNFDAAERKRAFLNATSEIPGLQGAVLEAACNSDQGYGLMQDYLSTHSSLPDVFLAFNDSVAFGALRALTDAGIRVPGDVGITGWDDISVAHDMALTTVHMPVDDLGRTAARMLLQKLDNEAAAPLQKVLTLEMPVCIRRSTMQPDALA